MVSFHLLPNSSQPINLRDESRSKQLPACVCSVAVNLPIAFLQGQSTLQRFPDNLHVCAVGARNIIFCTKVKIASIPFCINISNVIALKRIRSCWGRLNVLWFQNLFHKFVCLLLDNYFGEQTGGISPPAPRRTGQERLRSSGSHHPTIEVYPAFQ